MMFINRLASFSICSALTIILTGCNASLPMPGTTTKVTSGQDSPNIDQVQAEDYKGPKARIAVTKFTNKSGKNYWWRHEIGTGMADQLTTSLFHTNRFIVLERETLKDVMSEQDLGVSGRVRSDTAAPIGEIEGAELMVVAAVTEFKADESGAKAGGLGTISDVLGAIKGSFQKAHMAIDLRIVDTRTSRILAATSVEGNSTDVNLGGLAAGFGGGSVLAGGLEGWKNTPKEKALRAVIQEAVKFIVTKTPETYYHY